jgi:hypothetical protein
VFGNSRPATSSTHSFFLSYSSIMLRLSFFYSSILLASALAYSPCGIQGPDFPAPSGLAGDPDFQKVIEGITQSLDNVTEQSNAMLTPLKSNETSYSVVVFDAKSTLLSYHHTADAPSLAPESVAEVTGKAIVRSLLLIAAH